MEERLKQPGGWETTLCFPIFNIEYGVLIRSLLALTVKKTLFFASTHFLQHSRKLPEFDKSEHNAHQNGMRRGFCLLEMDRQSRNPILLTGLEHALIQISRTNWPNYHEEISTGHHTHQNLKWTKLLNQTHEHNKTLHTTAHLYISYVRYLFSSRASTMHLRIIVLTFNHKSPPLRGGSSQSPIGHACLVNYSTVRTASLMSQYKKTGLLCYGDLDIFLRTMKF